MTDARRMLAEAMDVWVKVMQEEGRNMMGSQVEKYSEALARLAKASDQLSGSHEERLRRDLELIAAENDRLWALVADEYRRAAGFAPDEGDAWRSTPDGRDRALAALEHAPHRLARCGVFDQEMAGNGDPRTTAGSEPPKPRECCAIM